MSDTEEFPTVVRMQVAVDDVRFLLAHDQNIEDLKGQVEAAALAGAGFVDFLLVGERTLSVLITPASRVVFATESVPGVIRGDEDDTAPFSSAFDLL